MHFLENIKDIQFVDVIELLGTVAFAISGFRLASAKRFDWFGALVVGYITAVGGGTLRDLLLGVPVFWMQSSMYIWYTLIAFFFVVCFRKFLVHMNNTIFWFDCFGLGLFTAVGFEKALMLGFPYWVCILMGMITGSVGGIIRDICINEIPIIFRQELYAMACIIGGVVFAALHTFGVDNVVSQSVTVVTVVVIRILAMKFHWQLPTVKGEDIEIDNKE